MTKMTKRIGAAMLSTALLLGALTGCGGNTSSSTDGDNAASASTENPHITVVLKTLASEYWAYVAKGCEQAGKDLGAEVDIQGATSETAYDEQLSMIETVLNASGTDAMVVAPLQSETVATQIANAEIPIIAIDTNVESDKVLSFVGFDNEAMASMGGEAAVEAAKDAGWDTITAIGIAGVQGDSTSEARMGGYKKGVEKAGGTYLDAETQYADGVSDKAVTAMEAIIQSHPEGIAIVVCNNDDMAVGAARAAASYPAYKNTIFVGCGGNVAALDAILAGLKICTVIQMKNDRKLRVKLCCCLNKLNKVYGIRILSCALGSLKNNGALQLCCCVRDSLNDFHVVDVESSDCVAAVISLLKQFCTSNDRHIKYHLSLK